MVFRANTLGHIFARVPIAGTDHSRETTPVLVMHKSKERDLGARSTLVDVAAVLADFFDLPELRPVGTLFLEKCAVDPKLERSVGS